MSSPSYKVSSKTISIDNLNKLFLTPLNELTKGESFNNDINGEIYPSGGIITEFKLNSDLSIYELLENITKYLKSIIEFLNK